MLHKIYLAWAVSFLLITGYEYFHHAYVTRRNLSEFAKEMLSMLLMIASIFYYVASAFLGALASLYLCNPSSENLARVEVVIGIFLGLWLLGIFLQLSLNLVRKAAGADTKRIIFFNTNMFRPLRSRSKK